MGGLYGRQRELSALRDLVVSEAPILVVRGAGGMGKSRLIAELLLEMPALPTLWVDLGQARDARGLLFALIDALNLTLPEGPPERVLGRVGEALAVRGPPLLILDDAEGVREHLGGLLDRLGAGAPGLRALIGTRSAPGLDGERTLALGPLAPDDALALFRERALAAGAGELPEAPLRALVESLDCCPLALELVARRAGALPLASLCSVGAEPLRLASRPGRVDRHASLEAVIRWSWGLLDPNEQDALEQLAAFVGPFDGEDAQSLLALPDGVWALDVLQVLRERSLIEAREGGFRLLGTLRSWLQPRMLARADLDALRARHAEAVLAASERAALAFEQTGGSLDPIRAREADLRVLAADLDRPELAARAGLALTVLALRRGPRSLAAGPLDALPLDGLPAGLAARVLLARVRLGGGDHPHTPAESERLVEDALRLAAGEGDVAVEAWITRSRGHLRAGRFRPALADATRAGGAASNPWLRATALHVAAKALRMLGRFDEAHTTVLAALEQAPPDSPLCVELHSQRSFLLARGGDVLGAATAFETAVALAQALGDAGAEARLRGNLVLFYLRIGQLDASRRCSDQALAWFRAQGDLRNVCIGLVNRAELDRAFGDLSAADQGYLDATRLASRLGMRTVELASAYGLSCSLMRRGQLEEAAARLAPLVAAPDDVELRLRPWVMIQSLVLAVERGHEADRKLATERLRLCADTLKSEQGAAPWSLARVLLRVGAEGRVGPELRAELEALLPELDGAGKELALRLILHEQGSLSNTDNSIDKLSLRLRRTGQSWTLSHGGGALQLKNSRGAQLLALLLNAPGQPMHVRDMLAAISGEDPDQRPRSGDAGELLDPRAVAAYRDRVSSLREALEEADGRGDRRGAAAARAELEALEDALRGAVGLGGRLRKAGDDQERARVSVRARINDVLSAVEAQDSGLGAVLRRRVSTGTWCVYRG